MSRIRLLPLVPLVLVLAVAGCGRETTGADGRIQSPDGSPVLARVGDYLITAKQVEARIRESVGERSFEESMKNPDIIQVALGALVDQVVWGKAAEAAGYDRNVALERDIYLYATKLRGDQYLKDTVDRQLEPSEEEIEEFYTKYQENYSTPIRVSVRHILLGNRAAAEDVLKRLLGGADFSQLARQVSEDQNTRELGGALGYVSRAEGALGIGKDTAFLSAALQLQPGEVSPVVQSARGWHVILCEAREGGEVRPLEEVRDDVIKRVQVHGKISDVYNTALDEARRKHGAVLIQDAIDEYTGVGDSVERLWEVVEMQPNDRGQIEVLRRISMDFKEHELADDAQFRIAYIYACKLAEPRRAQKALGALRTRFPKSELLSAAEWLEQNLDNRDLVRMTFDDLKARGRES
jgi:peptidyl-prolyl cis-trans isomerase C